MIEKRPLAVLVYCGLLAILIVVGAIYGSISLIAPSDVSPTLGDSLIGFLPLLMLAAGTAGIWLMRWWGVAVFWLCVLLMTAAMLFVPVRGDIETFLPALAMNVAIWFGVIALPPTLIAVIYRRRFR